MSLVIEYTAFFTQKRGNEFRHYEDAFALDGVEHAVIEGVTELEGRAGFVNPEGKVWRCAVADGATQGGFSKLWAQMLVDHFIYHNETMRGKPPLQPELKGVDTWLKGLSHVWNDQTIDKILNTVPPNSPRRSRMQQTLLLEGQAATLAMLEIDTVKQRWKAGIIGDSLVFHYRGDNQGKGAILPERPAANLTWDQLDTNPILISSKDSNQDAWVWNNRNYSRPDMFTEASFEPGDTFLLMTDAMAKWFLRTTGSSDEQLYQDALRTLFSMQSNADFVNWVESCRSLPTDDPHYINNDDMTLVLVQPVSNANGVPVQPMPVREVPAAKTQTTETQVAPPTVQNEVTAPQAEAVSSVSNTPVAPYDEADTTDDEGDGDDIYASNRQVTRMAPSSMMTQKGEVVAPSLQNQPTAPPIAETLPEQKQIGSNANTSAKQQVKREPSFDSIGDPLFDERPKDATDNTDKWVAMISEQIIHQNIDEQSLRQLIDQDYQLHAPLLADWAKGSLRRREYQQCIMDFHNKFIDIKQFRAFVILSEIQNSMRSVMRNKKDKYRDREQKSFVREYSRTIHKIGDEYCQQWSDRNRREQRASFLRFMDEAVQTGNLDNLHKLLN